METSARYTLIGLFSLAVILAGFAFVYWLNTGGGLGPRATYRVRYDSPVPGLLKGSAVLFNGIRVGEVTSLELDARNPHLVMATLAVAKETPVRADTRAGIEFQGLTGSPVVLLVGGSGTAAALASGGREAPLLMADANAGQGMTQTARDVMRHIDDVVKVNAEPLRNLIGNIDKFSGALARNSDRVDGIVAGLERLTGGGAAKTPPRIFELAAARSFKGIERIPAGQLLIPEPTALSVFDSDKILLNSAAADKPSFSDAQWPDMLPKLVQARIVQSFENAQYLRALGRAPEGIRADHQLLIDMRRFEISAAPAGAMIELAVKIVGNDGSIVGARIFRAEAPVAVLDAPSSAAALNEAFEQVAAEIVQWTCATI